jgi:mono/diheme cytochrome c family protein
MTLRTSAILLAASSFAFGDGQADFTTYCSACHGVDGKGAANGTFPPLAESPWLAGEPDRAIKVLLHGLQGPVTVGEKTFNLEMPPQGGVLKDDQIAGILTYVRSSWGNKGKPVAAAEITAIRSATSKRNDHWTADELQKLHPLEAAKPPIKNLLSKVYHGDWEKLPDFSKLESKSVEEEHEGRVSVYQADKKDHFAIVWDGDLEIAEDGNYLFELQADDAVTASIDGESLGKVDGIGPMSEGRSATKTLPLKKGDHKIHIEYLEVSGNEGILVRFKKEGDKNWRELSAKVGSSDGNAIPPIPVIPQAGEAVMYRNFIEDVSPRAIGVGYDGGVNLAFSADNLSVALVWTGAFIDAGRHWTDRGQGNQKPSGENLVRLGNVPGYAKLSSPSAEWPKLPDDKLLPFRFRGYKLNAQQQPTFIYNLADVQVADAPMPEFGEGGRKLSLKRVLSFNNPTSSTLSVSMLLAQDEDLAPGANANTFTLGETSALILGDNVKTKPVIRGTGSSKQLILPLEIAPGASQISLKYQW